MTLPHRITKYAGLSKPNRHERRRQFRSRRKWPRNSVVIGGGGGGSDAFSGYLTHTEGAAQAKTNEPFQIAWPLAPGELGTGQTLRVYDDDGSGGKGTVLSNFQVDGLSTDANSDERICVLSGFTPSLGSGATRKLHVDVSGTAAPTGTAITEADLFATAFRLVVSFNIGGTTTTIDTDDFEGASTVWDKAEIVRHENYMEGPGTTCFVYSAPVQAGGDGIRAYFHFYARKAGTAAVGGGNPIVVVDWEVELCNFDTERVSPVNFWYGLQVQRSTSLSDGTLITTDQTDIDGNVSRYVYARSQPAATLTATGATVTNHNINDATYSWTRSTGTWDSDILGAWLTDGTGYAYILTRTNSTTVEVRVVKAFAGTSFTSGNWTVEAIGHRYGSAWVVRGSTGTVATSKVLWGDNTTSGGTALTPTTKAAMTHLSSKKAIPNYDFDIGDVTHSMTALNLMRADNAIRPFIIRGPDGSFMGDLTTNISGAGNRDDLSQMFYPDMLAKLDANGRRKLLENADYWGSCAYMNARRYSGSPAAGSLGVVPRPDNGTHYSFDSRWGTFMAFPSLYFEPFDGDNGHQPETHYAAFLYTGKLIHIQRLQQSCFKHCMSDRDPTYNGTGINCTPLGDGSLTIRGGSPWGSIQQRGEAWTLRDLLYATIVTPDASKPSLFNAKSCMKQWVGKTWDRAKFVMDTYTNGNAGLGEDYYATDGLRWVGSRFNGDLDTGIWQIRYFEIILKIAYELGLTNADALEFIEWFSVGYIGISQSPDVAPDWMSTAYYVAHSTVNGSLGKVANVQTWAEIMQAWALFKGPYETTSGGGNYRRPASISLSATSGAAVNVTLTGSPFGQTSWYAGDGGSIGGGWIYETAGGSGCGRIVSVSDANHCVIDTTVTGGAAFSSTSPTASNVAIPIPHPADAGADGTRTGRDTVYMMLYWACGQMYKDYGIDTDACIAYIEGSAGFPAVENKFNILART